MDLEKNESQAVYRYDTGGKGFKKAAVLLIGLSAVLAVFGFFWVTSF